MGKRVFIAHGWSGAPHEGWFPWLKKQLEEKGYDVVVPQLPNAAIPRIDAWVPKIAECVGVADKHTYFVGHSMGCQAIVRYLESLPSGIKVGGAVFVAGFFKRLTGLGDAADVRATEQHWLNASIDMVKIHSHLLKSVAIFSDDDPWVPLDNQNDFRDALGSEVIIQHRKGHFSGGRDGTKELPIVLESLLRL